MVFQISKNIGIIHLSGMILETIYGFIFSKNILFDEIYIISFLIIPFSWIICKDECIISYFVKKYKNPNYILGNEPDNVKDITDLFIDKNLYHIFYNINHILRIISVIIVNNRTTKIFYFNPIFILYSFYVYDITYKLNYRISLYPYFQIIFSIYLFKIFYDILSNNLYT